MQWGSTEVARPHLNPATVAALVSPKTGSPFITRKTATITVKVSPECHTQKSVHKQRKSLEEDSEVNYDSSPSQDTTSSNSSTAALLKKTAHELHQGHDPNLILAEHIEGTEITNKDEEINYVDEHGTVASGKALLAKTLKEVKRSLQDLSPVFSTESITEAIKNDPIAQKKKTYLKNLIVMSLSCTLMWSPFSALRSLQSSVNHKAGLGLISMSSVNVFFVLGCICAVTAVQRIRPKFAMLFTMVGQVLFIASNYYPSFYTVIPAAAILGFCFAVFWTAQGVYLTSIGFMYATLTGKTADSILSLFNGFYFVSIQLGQILGHLISSSIFNMAHSVEETSTANPLVANSALDSSFNLTNWKHFGIRSDGICGINYCHSYKIEHPMLQIRHTIIYILLSVFLTMTFLSMLVNGMFLDKLDIIFHRSKGGLCKQMASMFYLHRNPKQLLFMWFTVYLGFEEAFFYGEMTKAFVTCPIGVHMVGYVMMCSGACAAITSVISGRLVKYVGRPIMVAVGNAIHAAILVLMFFWTPTSHDTTYIFLLVGTWGTADALLQTQALSLCGLLFPKQQEAAFASYRLYEAFGNMVAFGYAQFLCMQIKVYITGSILAMATVTYMGLEFYVKKQRRESETVGVGL